VRCAAAGEKWKRDRVINSGLRGGAGRGGEEGPGATKNSVDICVGGLSEGGTGGER